MPFIRSISGLRATLDDGLNKEIVELYTKSFALFAKPGPIVVGRDGRPSGEWIEQILVQTLIECGRDVHLLGIAPTPTVQLMTEHSNAGGGISITASHNPKEWNGLKFLDDSGVFLDAEQNKLFWNIVDTHCEFPKGNAGNKIIIEDSIVQHIQSIILALDSLGFKEYQDGIHYNVVVDAVNASGSYYVPALLNALNCSVIPLFCNGSGEFPHMPEPLPEHLEQLAFEVSKQIADIGVAVDPDADRLVLIDEKGQAIGEEKTIALAVMAMAVCADIPLDSSSITVNLSTSRMSDIIASHYHMKTFRSPVGEINVVKCMKDNHSIIGGEGSGGVIVPACHYGRDSLVGITLIIALMRKTRKTLSELVDSLPKTSMIKGKLSWTKDTSSLFRAIEHEFEKSSALIRYDDGIWIDFGINWLHVRASNTEPIVRYIVEASNEADAQLLVEAVSNIIVSNS